jgi:hypothetical protein
MPYRTRAFLRQFVSRGRLFVDPDRLTASPGDGRRVLIVPIAKPHRQRTPGLDLLDDGLSVAISGTYGSIPKG